MTYRNQGIYAFVRLEREDVLYTLIDQCDRPLSDEERRSVEAAAPGEDVQLTGFEKRGFINEADLSGSEFAQTIKSLATSRRGRKCGTPELEANDFLWRMRVPLALVKSI
jgi:hypothetical protein